MPSGLKARPLPPPSNGGKRAFQALGVIAVAGGAAWYFAGCVCIRMDLVIDTLNLQRMCVTNGRFVGGERMRVLQFQKGTQMYACA